MESPWNHLIDMEILPLPDRIEEGRKQAAVIY